MNSIDTPLWMIIHAERQLRDELEEIELLYDDPALEAALRNAAHILRQVGRDHVRAYRVSEHTWDAAVAQAELAAAGEDAEAGVFG